MRGPRAVKSYGLATAPTGAGLVANHAKASVDQWKQARKAPPRQGDDPCRVTSVLLLRLAPAWKEHGHLHRRPHRPSASAPILGLSVRFVRKL